MEALPQSWTVLGLALHLWFRLLLLLGLHHDFVRPTVIRPSAHYPTTTVLFWLPRRVFLLDPPHPEPTKIMDPVAVLWGGQRHIVLLIGFRCPLFIIVGGLRAKVRTTVLPPAVSHPQPSRMMDPYMVIISTFHLWDLKPTSEGTSARSLLGPFGRLPLWP